MVMSYGEEPDEAGKLFVGGISRQTTDDTFRKHFEEYGQIKACVLMKDQNKQSRGFGFVTYEDPTSVAKVLKARPHTLDGKQIDPKPCTPQSIQRQKKMNAHNFSKAHKIFVGGISMEATEDDLREYFERYGVVLEVVFVVDKNDSSRRHKGFGFVTFEDESSVEQAIAKHFHFIKDKRCEAKPAESREKMDAMKMQGGGNQYPQFNQMGGGNQFQNRGMGGNMGQGQNQMGYGGGMNQGAGNMQPNPMMGGQGGGYGGYGNNNYPTSYPQQYGANQNAGYGSYGNYGQGNMGQGGNMQGGMQGSGMGPGGYGGGMPNQGGMGGGNQMSGNQGMGNYPQQQSGYGPMKPDYGMGGNNNMPHQAPNNNQSGVGGGYNNNQRNSNMGGGGGAGYHPYRRT